MDTTNTPLARTREGCPFHAAAAGAAPAAEPVAASSPPGATVPAADPVAPAVAGAGAPWPPGPRVALTGWSLLGQMSRDLLGTMARWQRDHGDLVHLRIWPEHELMVADPALVRELLVQHHDGLVRWERGRQVFASVQGQSVLVSEGEAWRAKRQVLQPPFGPKPSQAFVPAIVEACGHALTRWPSRGRVDTGRALTAMAMDVIVRLMFSVKADGAATGGAAVDIPALERAVHDLLEEANSEFFWPASAPDWAPWKGRKRRGLRLLRGFIRTHVEARLRLPQDTWPEDLATRLLQLHREDARAWPLQAVLDECMTAFLAGHETTAATLGWWAWNLASNPRAQDAAREELQRVLQGRAPTAADLPSLPVLTATLQETLRMQPAAPVLFTRRNTREVTLGGRTYPARTMFFVPVINLHHDPRWFPQPEAFRPERFLPGAPEIPRGAWLPFGAGPRVCLGQHLAMAEMQVIAAMVLQKFRLAVPEGTAAPVPVVQVSLRPTRPIELEVEAVGG